jgi:hypothetical protein
MEQERGIEFLWSNINAASTWKPKVYIRILPVWELYDYNVNFTEPSQNRVQWIVSY